jgi:hypothetical protein
MGQSSSESNDLVLPLLLEENAILRRRPPFDGHTLGTQGDVLLNRCLHREATYACGATVDRKRSSDALV